MEYVIETHDLVKQYKSKYAVNNVSLHVKRGDIYGLIGRNGAGKTSLMKLILGLTSPTQGSIVLFGDKNADKGRKKIGSLIESPGLYRNCTAYENLLRFSMLYGTDKKQITPILQKVGLGDTGAKKAGEFSLGMRQRLGIAIALLSRPEILILDEPINGLDPSGIKEIRDMITELNAQGITFMISSHLLDELAKVVTVYGIISDGRLTEEISAHELQARCRRCVRIVGDDAQKTCSLLKTAYPDAVIDIENDEVFMSSHLDKTADINKYLLKNGIAVSEIGFTEGSQEEYFIERLGK